MKCTRIYLFVILLGIYIPSLYGRHIQFFRKDYTYIEEFDAFYKVHWDLNGLSWNSAFLACDDEGATLFYPKAEGETAVVRNLTNRMPEAPNITQIFVGLHDEFKLGEFITVDGQSTPHPLIGEQESTVGADSCIVMDINTGLFQIDFCHRGSDSPLPFVCKKLDDESCPTVDRGYKFAPLSRKCYKVNNRPKMWQEAMQSCFMEGGILAVIENSAESALINGMVEHGSTYFVGVRRIFSNSEYYSVKGQKFSEIYQNTYSNDNNYDCGSVFKNRDDIYTTTTDCGTRLPFICEMEVPKPN